MTERTIDYLLVDDIPRTPENPKRHAADVLDASLARHGYMEPVLLDERTGRLIGGHGRLDALQARHTEGHEPPDGVRVDDQGRWLVPVVRGWASASDLDAAAALVTLNRATELGGWDDTALGQLLQPLTANPDGLAGVGYTADEVAALLDPKIHVGEHDRTPPEPRDPAEVQQRVTYGDVWQLGPHRLMCGDCRNPDDVTVLLDSAVVNVAFTSPPYADRRKYDETSGFRPIPPDEYVAWFAPVAANVAAHLADDGSWFVNIKPHCDEGQRVLYVADLCLAHVREWGWMFVDELCWTRNSVPGGWPNRFKNAWEPVFHYSRRSAIRFRPNAVAVETDAAFTYAPDNPKSATGFFSNRGRPDLASPGMARPSNVLRIGAETNQTDNHSAPFPVHLPAWFLRAYSDEGDVLYDPFVGSGSSLLAAEQEGRVGFGMEISPGYCDVILDRWERHGGTAPAKVEH